MSTLCCKPTCLKVFDDILTLFLDLSVSHGPLLDNANKQDGGQLYFCNSLYECNKHKMMSYILKLIIMDATYSQQLLYSSVIVYVIEFYSIHCTKQNFNAMFVCFVVRGESPGCRLFSTASMLEWLRNQSTDTCSPGQLLTKQMKEWTIAHQ